MNNLVTVEDFGKVVETFGFEHPVTTMLWNTLASIDHKANYEQAEIFEVIYANMDTGMYNGK